MKDLSYDSETLEDQDWVRLTQSQFDPIQISERLWITPSWHKAPAGNAVNLQLDPGLAFGTGSHPTTRLCLKWLDTQLKGGESVLDYGCGSGILTIAALKLGAGSAVGVDIDEQAIRASNDNAAQNDVQAHFYLPDGLPQGQFDVVVANILANPLRMLGEMLAARTKQGGRIVLSGLLAEQSEELSEIYSQWFDIEPAENRRGLGASERRKTLGRTGNPPYRAFFPHHRHQMNRFAVSNSKGRLKIIFQTAFLKIGAWIRWEYRHAIARINTAAK